MPRRYDELPERLKAKFMLKRDVMREAGISDRTFLRYAQQGIFSSSIWKGRTIVTKESFERYMKDILSGV